MTNQQPKPLRLADALEFQWSGVLLPTRQSAAAELRRLHAENEALKAQLQQQEPVSYHIVNNDRIRVDPFTGSVSIGSSEKIQPVSTTHSQQRQPLSQDQAMKIVELNPDAMTAIRMTEAAHGIKGDSLG